METVKVDLQKLQLLNDRIAQTIEALNQLRLSTHGLQQAGTFAQTAPNGSGFGMFGTPNPGYAPPLAAYPQPGYAQPAYPQAIYPAPFSPIAGPHPGQGLSHSSPHATAFVQNGSSVYGWIDPRQQRLQAFPFLASVYPPIV